MRHMLFYITLTIQKPRSKVLTAVAEPSSTDIEALPSEGCSWFGALPSDP